MKIHSVATERLLLHPLSVGEAERVVAREPGDGDLWGEGYPGDGDVRAGTGFLRGVAERGDPGAFRLYEIRLRETGVSIGGIGFHGPPDELGVATIGYGLTPGARGRGYATEALRALVGIARQAGAEGMKGDADLGNPASHRVMEAAGMRRVAEDEKLVHYYLGF
ncbi:GNAT family N-acetyltransferase [Streptomyces sp. NPDC059352]|uniref:GNAT family N-acetyltransferase n=1 Tax=Streptomyces sp. NPDC059352 TaxID=3346810 RepID=UPI0036A0A7B7